MLSHVVAVRRSLFDKNSLMQATAALVLGLGMLLSPAFAHADDHRGWDRDHDRGREHSRGWERHDHRGRAYGHYRNVRDRDWNRGHWERGMRNGRYGWWWIVGYNSYYYAQPVYPYPVNPYAPTVVYAPPVVEAPAPSAGINLIIPFHIH